MALVAASTATQAISPTATSYADLDVSSAKLHISILGTFACTKKPLNPAALGVGNALHDTIAQDVEDLSAIDCFQGRSEQLLQRLKDVRAKHQSPLNIKQECPAASRKVACHFCGAAMLRKTLDRHVLFKHGNESRQQTCRLCNAQFKRKDILERHTREQHSDEEVMVLCIHCGRRVRQRSLKGRLETRKCRSAQQSSQPEPHASLSFAEASERPLESIGYPGLRILPDVLLICVNSHAASRSAYKTMLFAAARPKLPFRRAPVSPGHIPYESKINLLELRDLSIKVTLRNLTKLQNVDHTRASEHDRLTLAIAFLAAAEDSINSKRSAHTSYLLSHQRVFRDHRAALRDLRKVISEVHQDEQEVRSLTRWQYWQATLRIGLVTCAG